MAKFKAHTLPATSDFEFEADDVDVEGDAIVAKKSVGSGSAVRVVTSALIRAPHVVWIERIEE